MPLQFLIATTLGDITIELFDDTPLHRDNFARLVEEKYYDGLRFHRVIKDFVIQGGDPLSRDESKRALHGTGGPNYRIPAEIKHPNKRGTVAAARDNNPQKASSGSQFYINVRDNLFLDDPVRAGYTVFGKVIRGMDVVDAISKVEKDARDNPIVPITMTIRRLPAESQSA
ncbi:MAG: peptidylprolyl isomerase [Chloroherpetonaceae bacterium]|nr:peptidylprolyl isomerase [Chloroherpetonaceae bacterium]MCS7212061.1 peptidylprolyl isomerase [Chloroherpetonaceae bacterium]MDW8018518.1 peptidylprolyl isomerase [Chloroherpetonaceae bacterium]MDW8465623.1 peptidylprolyl isomerase [Chloroherpetonaceae bacterium]